MPTTAQTLGVIGGAAVLLLLAKQRADAANALASSSPSSPPAGTPPARQLPSSTSTDEDESDETPAPAPAQGKDSGDDSLFGTAHELDVNVTQRGKNYDRALVKRFQQLYNAKKGGKLATDGLYGPQTATAVAKVLGDAPTPIASAKGKTLNTSTAPSSNAAQLAEDERLEHENLMATSPDYREEHALKMMRAKRAAQLAAARAGNAAMPEGELFPQERGETKAIEEAEEARINQRTGSSAPAPVNLELARREAPAVATHIRKRGKQYSRQVVRDFQKHAGIVHDGKYGPKTQSALEHFGVVDPPAPIFPGPAVAYAEPEDANP